MKKAYDPEMTGEGESIISKANVENTGPKYSSEKTKEEGKQMGWGNEAFLQPSPKDSHCM
jgi:hypothetical protein